MTGTRVRILIADDEARLVAVLAKVLDEEGYAVFTASGGAEACAIAEREQVHLALVDLTMPDRSGLEVLRTLRQRMPAIRVLLMTAYASAETAVEAMKQGALDYLIKPVALDELKLHLRRAVAELSLEEENRVLRDALDRQSGTDAMIGASPGLNAALALARRVAESAATILILGESGTGKELIARELHRRSPRRTGPFLAINCAAIPESMLERELFGHEKGAFTGADTGRPGLIEAAAEGTLLLDEIGEMSPGLQARLLRVIEGHDFLRLGGTRPVRVLTRFVAATNRDLAALAKAGRFREDLYHRLNVVTIALPPLRDRGDDVVLLAEHFLRGFSADRGRRMDPLAPEVCRALRTYGWPGNIRELRNVIERAVLLGSGTSLNLTDLHLQDASSPSGPAQLAGRTLREAREAFERAYLAEALRSCGGNVTRTAERVGLDRRNLQLRLKRYGLKADETP